jgi:hypothetical protein
MSALAEKNSQNGHLQMGQNGRNVQWGSFAFNSTDATGTFKTNLRVVEAVYVCPAQAPNTDEHVYWADALSADGQFVVGADGLVTIGRTGTKTDALKGTLIILGF